MKLRMYLAAAIVALFALPAGLTAQARPQMQPPAPQPLTYEMAKHMAEAAEAYARQNNWNMVIVVADAEGTPIYLKRMTGAPKRIYDFAMGKVRTVVASGLSTKEYADQVRAGTLTAIPDAVALDGAFPIKKADGTIIGVIASSGVRPDQDAQVSNAGLAALANH